MNTTDQIKVCKDRSAVDEEASFEAYEKIADFLREMGLRDFVVSITIPGDSKYKDYIDKQYTNPPANQTELKEAYEAGFTDGYYKGNVSGYVTGFDYGIKSGK